MSLLFKQVCDMFDVSQTTDANMHETQGDFAHYHVHSCVSQAKWKKRLEKTTLFSRHKQEPPKAAARTTKPTDCMSSVYVLSGYLVSIAITSHSLVCCAELQSADGTKHLLTVHISLKLQQQLQQSLCGGSCHMHSYLSSQACTHAYVCCGLNGHDHLHAV